MIDFSHLSIDLLVRILIAALLGGLIGLERDIHGRAAGLRTHLLVSMGAAVFMIMSELVASLYPNAIDGSMKASDPGRIAAQVVTGIGFLGAGAILKEGFTVRGLTTAACLWIVAAIGLAAGGGYYVIAITTTLVALLALVGFHHLEYLYPKDTYRFITIGTTNDVDVSEIINIIKDKHLKIIFFDFERKYDTEITIIKLSIRLFHKGITDKLSHGIIKSLEQAGIPLKFIKWGHQ